MTFKSAPFTVNVSSKYGAPMGRRDDEIPAGDTVRLDKVPMVDGDYDPGGAYWGGGGTPLWCAWTEDGLATYVRAADREGAKAQLPGLIFDDARDVDLRACVVRGVAEIMWAMGWSDHVEEHGCCNLSGCEITSEMPEIQPSVLEEAEATVQGVEAVNGSTMTQLLSVARVADLADESQDDPGDPERYAEAFGNDLAHMTVGSGVSWFDDHAKFPLKVPRHEDSETRYLADELCTCDGNPKCVHCSAYNHDDATKCQACGKNPKRKSRAKASAAKGT